LRDCPLLVGLFFAQDKRATRPALCAPRRYSYTILFLSTISPSATVVSYSNLRAHWTPLYLDTLILVTAVMYIQYACGRQLNIEVYVLGVVMWQRSCTKLVYMGFLWARTRLEASETIQMASCNDDNPRRVNQTQHTLEISAQR